MTWAPASASIKVASGPGNSVLKSSTRIPSSGIMSTLLKTSYQARETTLVATRMGHGLRFKGHVPTLLIASHCDSSVEASYNDYKLDRAVPASPKACVGLMLRERRLNHPLAPPPISSRSPLAPLYPLYLSNYSR